MSERESDNLFYVREFLNKPGYHSTGMALGLVEIDGDGDLSAELTLLDCNRQIALDFNIWGSNDLATISNVAHKSRTLRRIVNEFCDAVDKGVEVQRRKRRRSS